MTNFAAQRWAETVTTGKGPARQILDKLCAKSDDDGRVFRDTADIARLCETGHRNTVRWIDYLEQHEFITQIRRMRPNASEAKPVILINYPQAAHLNGAITVLDYAAPNGTKVLYPREPVGLLTRGLQWSSNGTIAGVHPSHTELVATWRAQHADPAGGQRADPAGGATSDDNRDRQDTQHADPAGGQRADPAGGATSDDNRDRRSGGVPNEHPQTTPQEGTDQPNQAEPDGWLDHARGIPDTPGARFLTELKLPDGTRVNTATVRRFYAHVDARLTAGWTTTGIKNTITDATGTQVRTWGGFALTKLRDLPEEPPALPQTPSADERAHAEVTRMVKQQDRGAREAAGLLGLSWQEPERGDASAQEHLVTVIPAAAREFVENHREDLVAALTRSTRSSNAA